MSSNYKILLYFLKNLDAALKSSLGLRGRWLKIQYQDTGNRLQRNCKSNRFNNKNLLLKRNIKFDKVIDELFMIDLVIYFIFSQHHFIQKRRSKGQI